MFILLMTFMGSNSPSYPEWKLFDSQKEAEDYLAGVKKQSDTYRKYWANLCPLLGTCAY